MKNYNYLSSSLPLSILALSIFIPYLLSYNCFLVNLEGK